MTPKDLRQLATDAGVRCIKSAPISDPLALAEDPALFVFEGEALVMAKKAGADIQACLVEDGEGSAYGRVVYLVTFEDTDQAEDFANTYKPVDTVTASAWGEGWAVAGDIGSVRAIAKEGSGTLVTADPEQSNGSSDSQAPSTAPAATTAPAKPPTIALSDAGIGVAREGQAPSVVTAAVEDALGRSPDQERTVQCSYGGPDVREVQWGALYLYFAAPTEGDEVVFSGWLVDEGMATGKEPTHPTTAEGIGAGSTLEAARSQFASTFEIVPGNGLPDESPLISFGDERQPIVAITTGHGDADTISVMAHNVPCTENGFDVMSNDGAPSD